MDIKSIRRISREMFKDAKLGTRVIKPRKSKEEKYGKYFEYDDRDLDFTPFWEKANKNSR